MGISENLKREFLSTVVPDSLLEDTIDFISSNLEPEEVFDYEQLRDWAFANGFEQIDEDEDD
jgi:hypothetical protein